jgi:hypothetical protein
MSVQDVLDVLDVTGQPNFCMTRLTLSAEGRERERERERENEKVLERDKERDNFHWKQMIYLITSTLDIIAVVTSVDQ